MSIESLGNPARSAEAVTLGGGDVAVSPASRAVYVGGTGTLAVYFMDDPTTEVQFANIPVGLWPFRIVSIDDGNTSATDIVILR